MNALLFAVVLTMIFVPAHPSFSQAVDSDTAISVVTTSDVPYVYQNSEGYTTVVGEVENRNRLTAMSDIVVVATFLDASGNVLDISRGGPLLTVVGAQSTSPYVITSTVRDPDIAFVSVDVAAFNSSPSKEDGLEIDHIDVLHAETLEFSATISNSGNSPSTDTRVYLAYYDVFDPPRLLSVETIEAGDIPIGQTLDIEFSGIPSPRAVGFQVLAESDTMTSSPLDIDIPEQQLITRMVSISDLSVSDDQGRPASSVPAGAEVSIGSRLLFQSTANDRIQSYVYYVQIKQSGVPYVEFIGSTAGTIYNTPSSDVSVLWTPANPGLYFVETFVWDAQNVPIAPKGPVSLVLVR